LKCAELAFALGDADVVARLAPDQKRQIVEVLQSQGHVVAVTGDGVNDAPALRVAHIGIAMGLSGTDVAKAAADMVLLDDNFASIVAAVEEGRTIFQNIRKFLTYVLVHNVAELVPVLAFALFQIPLPLTPIQALAVDMGTDSLAALGLYMERPGPNMMRIPPRSPRRRLLDLPLALRSYLFLGMMEACTALAAFFYVLLAGGWQYGTALAAGDILYKTATTACMGGIIVTQIVNVFLCRSAVRSIFRMPLLDNPVILTGVALEIGLIVLIGYTQRGNLLLGTAPLSADVWVFLLPFAAFMLLAEEGRKFLVRRAIQRRLVLKPVEAFRAL
jgi:sodium/potassium-transporting ATPase subunit alpha